MCTAPVPAKNTLFLSLRNLILCPLVNTILWWLIYAISFLRVIAPKGERRRHENMSFCRYFAGRRQEKTKYAKRSNDILTGEGTKIPLLKISCRRVEIFSVVALFVSKREGRSNEKRHVFVFLWWLISAMSCFQLYDKYEAKRRH